VTDGRTGLLPDQIYRFLGHHIRVRSNSSDVLDHVRLVYGRFFVGHAADRAAGDDWAVEISDRLDEADELLLKDPFWEYRLLRSDPHSQFTRLDVKQQEIDLVGFCGVETLLQAALLGTVSRVADDHHLLHAGAVSRNGAAVLFPAPPGQGKTTLVLTLVRRGWGFLSDEIGCLSADGDMVKPFPRSLIVRPEACELLDLPDDGTLRPGPFGAEGGERYADAEAIVPGCLSEACPLRFVIFLRGFGETPRLERIANANALFDLFSSATAPIDDIGKLLFEFAPVLDRAHCYNLVIGAPEDTAVALADLVDRTTSAAE